MGWLGRYANRDTGSKEKAAASAVKGFSYSDEGAGEDMYDNPAEVLERSGFSRGTTADVATIECDVEETLDDLGKP